MTSEAAAAVPSLKEELLALVGAPGLLEGEDVRARSCDPLCHVPTQARFIVRPADTQQLADVMALCARRGQRVVVQGGRTGVSGGAYASEDDVVVSLERMSRIEDICATSMTAVVQAGVTVEALQNAAQAQGLFYPVDLGSKGTATIGGTIATNAGGNRVVRWGMTRQNVLGLEAVLADGTVLSCMNRLVKNNTGYDLKQLFIGSEGTLGVVTRAVVRLVPMPVTQSVAFVSVASYEHVMQLLGRARQLATLSAFEVMWADYYELVARSNTNRQPLPTGQPFYVLIEGMGYDPDADERAFAAFLEAMLEADIIVDAVLATSDRQRQDLWRVREGAEIIVREMSPFVTFDVSVELPRLEVYLEQVRAALRERYDETRIVTFGHLGDNNIHIGVTVGAQTSSHKHDIEQQVYGPLPAFGGALTAEHGIGRFKRAFLLAQKTPAELAVMARLREALDPLHHLNPEVMN